MSKLTKILTTGALLSVIPLSPLESQAGNLPEIEVNMEDYSFIQKRNEVGNTTYSLNAECKLETSLFGGIYVTKSLGTIGPAHTSTVGITTLGPQIGCEKALNLFQENKKAFEKGTKFN